MDTRSSPMLTQGFVQGANISGNVFRAASGTIAALAAGVPVSLRYIVNRPFETMHDWDFACTRTRFSLLAAYLHIFTLSPYLGVVYRFLSIIPTCTQSAVRRSFQPLRAQRIYSVNVLNFQWTGFIHYFMHMRDKTVCEFWAESLKAGLDCCLWSEIWAE